MTRKEAERIFRQENTLQSLGFTRDEANQLRRISMTLHRWHELECGDGSGCYIEREEDTGDVRMVHADSNRSWPIPDRETGARKRLEKILKERNKRAVDPVLLKQVADFVSAYVQTDPRGAALYILRPGDVPEGEDVSAYYNRGICVY